MKFPYIQFRTPPFLYMDKVPDPEITRVNDIIGLVSRKVKQGPITPVAKHPPAPTKTPPAPIDPKETSYVARALSVYNGWIPFDDWLNRSDTTWRQCSLVARVLSGRQDHALRYLTACDLPADKKTAAYLRGKIAAMEGISLLRQIYTLVQQGVYTQPVNLKADVTRFNRLVCATADVPTVANDMFTIAQSAASLDEFEIRWFSTIAPVNNLIHVRRIFKARVTKNVLHECLSMLHQRQWEVNFGMYYFLGLMSRLYSFDLYHPYWNEDTMRPLRNLFFLFSQVEGIDFDFTRQMFPALIPVLRSNQSTNLDAIYTRFIAWLLYKSALRRKDLPSVVETLCIWEKQLAISIRSNPRVLTALYRELAYYDLAYAEREVRKVVVIVDPSQQK